MKVFEPLFPRADALHHQLLDEVRAGGGLPPSNRVIDKALVRSGDLRPDGQLPRIGDSRDEAEQVDRKWRD